MSDLNKQDQNVAIEADIDFEVLETSEATALEEMGASSTIGAGSTCSKQDKVG
jgi:hypothetical protein